MEKIKLSQIRAQFPMYGEMSDEQLLMGLRKKFYSDIPPAKFYDRIDFDTQRMDPTAGMTTTEKVLAGVGKSFVDLGRTAKRIGNMVGIGDYDQAAAKRDEELDKPLMNTTAGTVGKVAGDIALTAVPGYRAQQGISRAVQAGGRMLPQAAARTASAAAPYVGAAGSGALIGAAVTPDDMSGGATVGALAGVGGEAGGRLLAAGYGGAKAIVEPLYEAGRERILKRTLDRFATNPDAVRAAAQSPKVLVPGSTPTLAEATMDPGIAQLQRGSAASSPDVASALAESRARQVGAYRSALDDLAGTDGRREFFESARKTAADELYGQARAGGLQMNDALQAQVNALLRKPSIKSAVREARELAEEKGMSIADPKGSAAGLMAVDDVLSDKIGSAVRSGNDKMAGALRDTQEELRSFLDVAAPAYGEARRTFQEMSRPVNQMAVGQRLRDRAFPAITEFDPNIPRVNAESYAKALRDSGMPSSATGLRSATLENTLDQAQRQTVENIGQDMARYTAAQEIGRVPGSPTAQYLGAQNILRQVMGPLGMPESALDSMAGRVAAGLMGTPFRWTQSKTEQLLARALSDPQTAAKIMAARDPRTIAELLQPFMAQAAIQADTQ